MGVNGHNLSGGVPIIEQRPARRTYAFDEAFLRKMAGDMHEQSQNAGGALMMPDPTAIICFRVMLDKFDEMGKRLAAMEAEIKALRAQP